MAVNYTLNGVNYTTSGTAANPRGSAPAGATNVQYSGSYAAPATPQELQQIQTAATAPRYDIKTGLLTDYGKSLGLQEVNKGVITSSALQYNTPIPIPAPTPKTSYTTSNAGLGQMNPDGTLYTPLPETIAPKTAADYMKEVMATTPKPQSVSEGYNQLEQQSGVVQARQQKANTQSAINAITASANADIMASRNQSSESGGTVGILSAREDAINRSANIKLLPLQAQLATDQANVELAQTYLDTLFKIYSEDVKANNEYYYKVGDVVRGYMDKQEQRQYDAVVAKKKAQDDVVTNDLKFQKDLALKAIENGQGNLVAGIMSKQPPVIPASNDKITQEKYQKDYQDWLASVNDYASKIALDPYKQAQINALNQKNSSVYGTYTPGANPTVDAWAERIQNGTAKITEIPASQTGLRNAVTVALQAMGNSTDGKPTTTELGKAALTTANSLLTKFNEGKGTSAVGKSGYLNSFGYGFIPGTDRANFVTDFNSLKSQLSLEGVKYLKGQGQVSDAERALLASAVTKLNLSQSEGEFKSTLKGIIDKLEGNITNLPPQQVVTAPDGSQVIITD